MTGSLENLSPLFRRRGRFRCVLFFHRCLSICGQQLDLFSGRFVHCPTSTGGTGIPIRMPDRLRRRRSDARGTRRCMILDRRCSARLSSSGSSRSSFGSRRGRILPRHRLTQATPPDAHTQPPRRSFLLRTAATSRRTLTASATQKPTHSVDVRLLCTTSAPTAAIPSAP